MLRQSTTLTVLLACLLAGCMGQLAASTGLPVPGGVAAFGADAPEESIGPMYAAGEDQHWLVADDYFISEEPYVEGWIWAHLAKVKRPPSPESKNQGLFFALHEGRDIWTRYHWRTRPAEPHELVVGALAICFNDNNQHDVYRAPSTKREARAGLWFMGRITDVSDAFKRQVRVGIFDCTLDAVRIVER